MRQTLSNKQKANKTTYKRYNIDFISHISIYSTTKKAFWSLELIGLRAWLQGSTGI